VPQLGGGMEIFMKNKLNGRDFITIGIFNAIGIVYTWQPALLWQQQLLEDLLLQELALW